MSVVGRDKQEVDSAAWDAFAREDRATRAPAALESRVRGAVAARATNRPDGWWRGARVPQAWRSAATAAALLAAIGVGLLWSAARRPVEHWPIELTPRDIVLLERTPVEAAPSLVAAGTVHPATPRTAPPRGRAAAPGPSRVEPPVAARVTTAPGEPGERLQMVRLRMPLSELGALGVRLSDLSRPSDEARWVDVDVVVGVDGWPRDVLRIASVDPGEL